MQDLIQRKRDTVDQDLSPAFFTYVHNAVSDDTHRDQVGCYVFILIANHKLQNYHITHRHRPSKAFLSFILSIPSLPILILKSQSPRAIEKMSFVK
jgi:hypothetical protein